MLNENTNEIWMRLAIEICEQWRDKTESSLIWWETIWKKNMYGYITILVKMDIYVKFVRFFEEIQV